MHFVVELEDVATSAVVEGPFKIVAYPGFLAPGDHSQRAVADEDLIHRARRWRRRREVCQAGTLCLDERVQDVLDALIALAPGIDHRLRRVVMTYRPKATSCAP